MKILISFWKSLSQGGRFGIMLGSVVIISLTGFLAWWTLRVDYQVLFSDLKPQDARSMVAELDRLKQPYKLSEDGSTILMDASIVHPMRLKLMGNDLSLQGAVGLEIFNNTDFGMTEFAQKVNYQRALQGEIARTIQSLTEIRDVRVLLALPEQGLFKQPNVRPKASITVGLKSGQALKKNQISGIQRLVAASVSGMMMQDVTIVNIEGVALTRQSESTEEEASSTSSSQLELKREMEAYLSQKALSVLEKAYGAGEALASVDVVLNTDHIKITTEEVLPGAAQSMGAGLIVRERESTKDQVAPWDGKSSTTRSGGTQREVEYAVGKRIEHIITQPGTIRRLNAVAVIKKSLNAVEEARLRELLASAVGASIERGDQVVVQSLSKQVATAEKDDLSDVSTSLILDKQQFPQGHSELNVSDAPTKQKTIIFVLSTLLMVSIVGFVLWLLRKNLNFQSNFSKNTNEINMIQLTEQEREAMLTTVKEWLRLEEPRVKKNV